MKAGESIEDAELDARIAKQKPANCCALIYTSGTTGNPKAVMISHDNFTWTARAAMKALTLNPQDHLVSYLPLSHVAAQMLDVITPLLCGCTVWFADSNALKGSLLKTLQEVRPTLMLGVPRVWEKMVEGVKAKGKDTKGFKKTLVDWAKTIGTAANTTREGRADPPWGYWLANTLVFSKLRTALGLDRCRAQFSAAAPISREVTEFMMALNVPIYEIYGMSECTGPQTISTADHFKLGSTGRGIPGVEMKIDSPNKEGDGEICYRGRHVFMGYLHDEQKTREAIDPEGWLHSGDVGRVDEEGYLRITGRIKEILITAGGENVAPVLIEDTIKEEVPIISNCMVIGDRRKFLSLLVTLKSDMDGEGRPLNKVYAGIKSTLVELGCTAETVSEAIKDPKVREYVDAGIKRANERAISNAQRIAKWEFLSEDFSVPGDELGPTLKLKRPIVMKKQATVIEAFYA
jgi:long-chain-fatty-acid--CoA ligase ACSBG